PRKVEVGIAAAVAVAAGTAESYAGGLTAEEQRRSKRNAPNLGRTPFHDIGRRTIAFRRKPIDAFDRHSGRQPPRVADRNLRGSVCCDEERSADQDCGACPSLIHW